MPIYEYRCGECGEKFDKWHRSMSGMYEVHCPKCGSQSVNRAVSLCCSTSPVGGASLADSSCAPTSG